MFTTTRIKTRDMADVDRLKCLDEGSEHSNCLVIKLIKLRMINHSGLGPVLGGFEDCAFRNEKVTNASWEGTILECSLSVAIWMRGRQPDTRQPRLPARLPHGKACCIQRHTKMWWPVDP